VTPRPIELEVEREEERAYELVGRKWEIAAREAPEKWNQTTI
jgi:hypothetical protein